MSELQSEKKSTQFAQKVSELSNLMSDTSSKIQKKEGGVSIPIIIGILIPFFIGSGLFWGQPSFVKNKEGDRENKKVFFWTLLFTAAIWTMMYIGMYYSGSHTPIFSG